MGAHSKNITLAERAPTPDPIFWLGTHISPPDLILVAQQDSPHPSSRVLAPACTPLSLPLHVHGTLSYPARCSNCVPLQRKKKEEEEKDNDEWVLFVILTGIGLGAQVLVLLLELKKKVKP